MQKLYAKIFKVQQEIGAIAKDAKNPFFKSNYFDINGLLNELKPLLNKIGLVVIQPLSTIDNNPAISTIIIDPDTGERIVSDVVLPIITDPQKFGSTITYYRRYSLQSFFLLQAKDDDGNSTTNNVQSSGNTAPVNNIDLQSNKCNKCGADMRMSKANKMYCSKKCWLKDEELPVIQQDINQSEIKPEDIPF